MFGTRVVRFPGYIDTNVITAGRKMPNTGKKAILENLVLGVRTNWIIWDPNLLPSHLWIAFIKLINTHLTKTCTVVVVADRENKRVLDTVILKLFVNVVMVIFTDFCAAIIHPLPPPTHTNLRHSIAMWH